MDVVYVRTKLQALIALDLLRRGDINKSYVLVKLFQYHVDEDHEAVYFHYRKLEERAAVIFSDVTAGGVFRSLAIALLACLVARLSGGKVFNANITLVPLALAMKVVKGTTFCSFDDGFANIVPDQSPYYSYEPLSGTSYTRRVLRRLLPKGAAWFVRQHIHTHFSIYPGRKNIVSSDQVVMIDLCWQSLLTSEDREKLDGKYTAVLIGTKYDEWPPNVDARKIVQELKDKVDLYLPHPRESHILIPNRAVRLDAPAEAAIAYLAETCRIRVYHLDSSVAFPFVANSNVDLRNVAPKNWSLSDVPEIA